MAINKATVAAWVACGIGNGFKNGGYPSIVFEGGERMDIYDDVIYVTPSVPSENMQYIYPEDLADKESFEEMLIELLADYPPVSIIYVSGEKEEESE